ncbi:DUF3397 domain-containing protein [Solibacillus daqui]|uniref:DUF3397 domain-containing protein n=1 Tax=Solibacillus daqui TaxID=2912187 RepID=UPI0023656691|nr:DUF3397 domain-containing protein [Solibacillus daqui]
MILFLQFMLATIIIFPIIAFLIMLIVCRILKFNKQKAIGLAADVTTLILLFSVPIAIRSLWELSIWIPMLVVLLIVAIIFTYMDWRSKKEIEVGPLLKKIWRVDFLMLSLAYFTVWLVGIAHSVMIFMMIE